MSDENDPFYQDAVIRMEAIDTILNCTEYWPSNREYRVFKGLLAEVERLRAEVAALKAQRDEARRLFCENCFPVLSGTTKPERVAKLRGWDCFDAKEAKS